MSNLIGKLGEQEKRSKKYENEPWRKQCDMMVREDFRNRRTLERKTVMERERERKRLWREKVK